MLNFNYINPAHIMLILGITCLSLGLMIHKFSIVNIIKRGESKILLDITIPFMIIFFGLFCIFSNESNVNPKQTLQIEDVVIIIDDGKILNERVNDVLIEYYYNAIIIPEAIPKDFSNEVAIEQKFKIEVK